MERLFLLLLLAAMSAMRAYGQNTDLKPYLQASFPQSIVISWKTDNSENPRVEFGETADNLNRIQQGTTQMLHTKGAYIGSYHYHMVRLTDLTPNTGYYYRIYSGDDSSPVYYFRTPHEEKPNHVRFIILGDHQLLSYKAKPYYKFNELVKAAKNKTEELYGTPLADAINLVVNVGDQVDMAVLEQFEKIHFAKQSPLTHGLPVITAVGNHETYGIYQGGPLQAYADHFAIDAAYDYMGISSSTARYYAYKNGNVLFIVIDSELPHDKSAEGAAQIEWLKNVVNAAKNDEAIDWIISTSHKPYVVEQYSNDIFPTYGEIIYPILKQTEKFVMHIAGHHHMYARGQFVDHNGYHIISGGTAWPQYWGDSPKEKDLDEVQGTWSNFAYQIVDIDNQAKRINVKCYTIGSLDIVKNNTLLDEFSYQRGVTPPDKPSLINSPAQPITLPYTFSTSPFSSPAGQEMNSVQFQISATKNFSIILLDRYQHRDNWYGKQNGKRDETENIGLGDKVTNLPLDKGILRDGVYYIRARHRDKNLGWSPWSETVKFQIGKPVFKPEVSADKPYYALSETINLTYLNGSEDSKDVIRVCKMRNIIPVEQRNTDGQPNGTMQFSIDKQGLYRAGYYQGGLIPQLKSNETCFWVGAIPVLTTSQSTYTEGQEVAITIANHPKQQKDWIGIYPVGTTPQRENAVATLEVESNASTLTFPNLANGYYYAQYHLLGEDYIAGEKAAFQVGDEITKISLEKTEFLEGEPITINFQNSPGHNKDYIGLIIDDGNPPNTENLWTYKYFGGLTEGKTTINGTEHEQGGANQLPIAGTYRVGMYTNDSYTRVSNEITIAILKKPILSCSEAPAGAGHVKVMRGNDELKNNDELAMGEILTITALPAQGFQLQHLTLNGKPLQNGQEISVTGDVAIKATFEPKTQQQPLAHRVTFAISGDKGTPHATIIVNNQTLTANSNGICSLELSPGTYPYVVQAKGYHEIHGELTVENSPIQIVLTMNATTETQPTPVELETLAEISISPNPCHGLLHLAHCETLRQASLYSLSGVLIKTVNHEGCPSLTLDLSALPEGVYLLQITDYKGKTTARHVVKL